MKVLSDTSVYKYTELLGKSKLSDTIKKLVDEKNGAVYLKEEQLEDVFYKIRHKSFNYKAKFGVIDLFRNGTIRLVYNSKVKLTVAVPFFAFKQTTGGLGVVINVTNYAREDTDGSYRIDPLVLYSLMLSGAYLLKINGHTGFIANSGVPELYTDLFVASAARIINMDMTKREKMRYLINKYFHMQLGFDEKRSADAAKQGIKYLDDYAIEQLDLAYPVDSFNDLETLVNKMRESGYDFNGLTFGLIFDKWIKAYGEASCFAIEYIPYFILMFTALITNCNSLVNVKSIEKEASKDSKKLIVFFDRIESEVQSMA